jgi:hypothetical protein
MRFVITITTLDLSGSRFSIIAPKSTLRTVLGTDGAVVNKVLCDTK